MTSMAAVPVRLAILIQATFLWTLFHPDDDDKLKSRMGTIKLAIELLINITVKQSQLVSYSTISFIGSADSIKLKK